MATLFSELFDNYFKELLLKIWERSHFFISNLAIQLEIVETKNSSQITHSTPEDILPLDEFPSPQVFLNLYPDIKKPTPLYPHCSFLLDNLETGTPRLGEQSPHLQGIIKMIEQYKKPASTTQVKTNSCTIL